MASKKLEWILSMVDGMSGPASKVSRSLEAVDKRMRELDRAETRARFEKEKDPLKRERLGLQLQRSLALEQQRTATSTGSWVAWLDHALGIASKLGGAMVSIARAAGDVALRTGRMAIEAASFKENNLIAFKVLLGSESAANRMMQSLVNFAAATPFETRDVMKFGKDLLVGGFKEQEIPIALKAVGDVAAMRDFDKTVIERLILAMSQVKAKGRLQGSELLQFAEAGVPIGKVYQKLGDVFGTTADRARKLVETGKVDANTGVFAIIKTIRDDLSGGQLGNMMDKTSQTVGGLWSTLSSKPFEMLMDLDKSGGFKTLKSSLSTIIAALDQGQPRIKDRIDRLFTSAMEGLLGPFNSGEGEARVTEMVDKILDAFDRVEQAGRRGLELVGGFDGLATSIAKAVEYSTRLLALVGRIAEFGERHNVVEGTLALAGDEKAIKSTWERHKAFQARQDEQAKGSLFNRLFGDTPENQQRAQEVADVRAMVASGASAAELEARFAPTPGMRLEQLAAGRTVNVNGVSPNITVNVTGADAADPAAIGKAAAGATTDAIGDWFDQYATSQGV